MPHTCMPCTFVCPYICTPQGCTPPHMPSYSSVHLCIFGGFACCGGFNELPFALGHLPYTTSVWGASLSITPHTQLLVSCASVCFRDFSMLCVHFPSVEGLGVFPHHLGGLGASALEMSIFSFLYIFCSALCLMF